MHIFLEENVVSTIVVMISLFFFLFPQEDERFLSELFHQLGGDEDVPTEKRRDLVLFLKEFCTFSQTLQPNGREAFFKVSHQQG